MSGEWSDEDTAQALGWDTADERYAAQAHNHDTGAEAVAAMRGILTALALVGVGVVAVALIWWLA